MSDLKIGKVVRQDFGFKAEIIEVLQNDILKVRFQNGIEKFCKRKAFLGGKLCLDVNNKMCEHEVILQSNGELVEVIELLPMERCMVEFVGGVQKMYTRGTVLAGNCTSGVDYKTYVEGREVDQLIPDVGSLKAELIYLIGKIMCKLRFEDGSECICLRTEFMSQVALPLWLERREDGVYYKETGELLVSIEWDEFQCTYVGVLRRSDGSEYTSLLNKE